MSTEFETAFGEGDTGDIAGQSAAQQAISEMEASRVDFAVVFCSPTYDCDAVIEGVRSVIGDTELIGATADGTFTERGVHTSSFMGGEGVIVALVASDEMRFFTALGRNATEDPEGCIAQATADLPTEIDGYPHLAGIILTSTLFGREELVLRTYQEIPIEWSGGGANDLSLDNITVFAGGETATDAVVLAVIASKQRFALGIGNRHAPIGGSYRVTKSDGDVVLELDGRPAYEVWKEAFHDVAEEQYGFSFDEIEGDPMLFRKAFSELVFGLRTGGDKYKVRAPWVTPFFEPYADRGSAEPGTQDPADVVEPKMDIPTLGALPEGALKFPHPIPEGVVLYPMTSGKEGTIERGTKSAQHAMAAMDEGRVAGGLVFECPCGEFTLKEDYPELIDATVGPIDAPIAGIQSGGDEICFRRDDMRGLHETATTVLLFPGGEPA